MRLKLSIFCMLTGLLVCAAPALAGKARLFTGTFGGAGSNVPNPYALGEAWSIAVDSSSGPSSGDVYIADPKYHRVEKFDSAGHFKLMFGAGVIAAGVEGTGDLTAGSRQVTSVATTERTFLPTEEITGAGIPSGTTIVDIGVGTLTLSNAATASGTKVALSVAEGAGNVANNEQQKVALENGPTGGAFRLTLKSATMLTTVAAGSNQVTATSEVGGTLHVGDTTQLTSTNGSGDVAAGSTTVSNVTAEAGHGGFAAGQPIEGSGIPAGTTIVTVGSETLTLSAPAVQSHTKDGIKALTKVAAIDAATGAFTLSAPSRYNSAFDFGLYAASETTSAIPYNASSVEVQKALESLAGIGAGNVSVSGSVGGPWTVEFKGPLLADTHVPQLSVDATTLIPGTARASVTTSLVGHSHAGVCEAQCQPGNAGSTPGAFTGPMSLGVDSSTGPSAGDVYVGEMIEERKEASGTPPVSAQGVEGQGAVIKFNEEGKLITSWGSGGQIGNSEGQPLGAVGGVTVDPSGNLWIDGTGIGKEQSLCCGYKGFSPIGRVFELGQDATFVRDWLLGPSIDNGGPLAADGEGNVYLSQGGLVTKYTASGEVVQLITANEFLASKGAFAFDSSTNSIFQGVDSFGGTNAVLNRYEVSCHTRAFSQGCAPTEDFTSSHFRNPQSNSGGLAVDPKGALDTLYDAHRGGEVAMFSIETLPVVTTLPAAGFTSTSATLNGSVNPEGVAISQCYFEWEEGEGEGEGYGHTVPCESPGPAEIGGGNATVAVHAKIATQRGKTYRFRLVAANGSQIYEPTVGSSLVFGPPRVDDTSVVQITTESATLQAQVDPRNVETEYRFEYLSAAQYKQNGDSFSGAHAPVSVPLADAALGAGETDLLASQHVSGLAADTAYRYRVVAHSRLGEGAEAVDGPTQSFTTWGTGSFGLPDGRAWELVSPPNKHGALVEPIGEDWVIQASVQGGRMVFVTRGPTEAQPPGYLIYQSVLATRSSGGGWSSHDLAVPHTQSTDVSVGMGWEYRFFSEDLSHAVVQPFGGFVPCETAGGEQQPCLSKQATEQTAFLQDLSTGAFTPMVTGAAGVANVPAGTKFGQISTLGNQCPPTIYCGPRFLDATADASHELLESYVGLTPSPTPGKPVPSDSLYEWSEKAPPSEQLRLVSVLPGNEKGEALPAAGADLGHKSESIRGVLSPDGELVVFEAEKHLYLRERATRAQSSLGAKGECLEAHAACTIQIDAGLAGEPAYQTASTDLMHLFFTDSGDLYEYAVSEGKLVRVTSGAEIIGAVIGAAQDGSYVYFAASGAIAPGAAPARCGSTVNGSTCNLYVVRRGQAGWEAPKLVTVLAGSDQEDWGTKQFEALAMLAARVSPDGTRLAFVSQRSLTGYDNRDAVSGERDTEVYEYDAAAESLTCVSCNPTGSRPHGVSSEQINTQNGGVAGGDATFSGWVAGNVPGWTPDTLSDSVYQSRYLDNSGRLFFDSSDALAPKDINGTEDVYEYDPEGVPSGQHACSADAASGSVSFDPAHESEVEGRQVKGSPGCVGLISSGESPQESAFLDASEGGGEVFFMTSSKLAGQDTDTSYDVYDARECTSQSRCAPAPAAQPPACTTEASCRPAPSAQPEIFGPSGSQTFSGPGNPTPAAAPTPVSKRAKSLTRTQKLNAALKACRRDRGRARRKRCERAARRRYRAGVASARYRGRGVGNANRGGRGK